MNTKIILFVLSLILSSFSINSLQAQVSSGGNMIVAENGALFIVGTHSFAKGSGFITPGIIRTSRTGAKGYVNFGVGSSWTGATEGRFINGYVRVTHEQAFVFPIGDANNYRPVASSGAINTTAAYFSKGVAKAFVNRDKGLSRVSDSEYWDIGGDTPVTLSFTWGADSKIANLTGAQIEQLTLVGWKNNQWEIIPSSIVSSESTTLKSNVIATVDFDQGSISTKKEVVPDDFKFITLGALSDANKAPVFVQSEMVSVYPNPVAENVYVDLKDLGLGKGEIKIYDMDGKEMVARTIDRQSKSIQQFDASNFGNGLYKVHVKLEDKQVTQQFMVGRTY